MFACYEEGAVRSGCWSATSQIKSMTRRYCQPNFLTTSTPDPDTDLATSPPTVMAVRYRATALLTPRECLEYSSILRTQWMLPRRHTILLPALHEALTSGWNDRQNTLLGRPSLLSLRPARHASVCQASHLWYISTHS